MNNKVSESFNKLIQDASHSLNSPKSENKNNKPNIQVTNQVNPLLNNNKKSSLADNFFSKDELMTFINSKDELTSNIKINETDHAKQITNNENQNVPVA